GGTNSALGGGAVRWPTSSVRRGAAPTVTISYRPLLSPSAIAHGLLVYVLAYPNAPAAHRTHRRRPARQRRTRQRGGHRAEKGHPRVSDGRAAPGASRPRGNIRRK